MTSWGFIATGGIAATVAGDLALTPGARRLAVASRDADRAAAFAEKHGFERSYGSYAELLADPDVDVVYVATPHGQHRAVARAALEAGKPVLVEKSFTTTLAGTQELAALAADRGLFAMEAMWTRFLPTTVALLDLVSAGGIGEVRAVYADLGFPAPLDPTNRFYDMAKGGGALLDVGVYAVAVAQMLLGAPEEVLTRGRRAETGVDTDATLLCRHAGEATASLFATITSHPPRRCVVIGTTGRVETDPPLHAPSGFTVHRPDAEPERVGRERTGRGYTHMLGHVQDCLAQGLTESPLWPLSATLTAMGTLESALHALGVVHDDSGTLA